MERHGGRGGGGGGGARGAMKRNRKKERKESNPTSCSGDLPGQRVSTHPRPVSRARAKVCRPNSSTQQTVMTSYPSHTAPGSADTESQECIPERPGVIRQLRAEGINYWKHTKKKKKKKKERKGESVCVCVCVCGVGFFWSPLVGYIIV